jgi:hypothetical protein
MASVEDRPDGWTERASESNFTITLLVFSWALLPVGFMLMLLLFNRYPEQRFPLSVATYGMLVFTFITGVGQRQSALRDDRVFLSATMLFITGVTLVAGRALSLDDLWWVGYAAVLGCVPMLFVAMSHLASCTAPGLERPWQANLPVPATAFPTWRVVSAVWTQGEMMWSKHNGMLCVLYGALENEQPVLRLEAFAHGKVLPLEAFGEIDWDGLALPFQAMSEEA